MQGKSFILLYEREHVLVLRDLIQLTESILFNKGHKVQKIAIIKEIASNEYFEQLKKVDADYFITFAMAGFNWSTLTGHVSYNLLSAKQIHILIGNYSEYDEYLRRDYAINLFFFTDNATWTVNWKKKYRGVPYLEKIPTIYIGKKLSINERQADERTMSYIIQKVMDMAEGNTDITIANQQLEAW